MLQKFWRWLNRPAVKAAIFLIAVLLGYGIWYNRVPIVDFLTPDSVQQSRVAISVGTPTVHTRERLLNDRFEQVAWLDNELKNTLRKTVETIQPPASTTAPSTPASSADPAAAAAAKEAEAQKLRIKVLSDLTEQVRYGADDPRKSFEMMNGFRDVLRAERARAMLDDRHDMDDNTLDLFSFDTTVMPRDGMHGSAAIEVLLTRDPAELLKGVPARGAAERRFNQQKYKDLFDTYVGWLEKVRQVQQSRLATVIRTLDTVDASQFDSSDYELLLRQSACSELLRVKSGVAEPKDQRQASAEARQAACRATLAGTTPWDRWERRSTAAPSSDDKAASAMNEIDLMLASVKENVLTRKVDGFLEEVDRSQQLNREQMDQDRSGQNNSVLKLYVAGTLRSSKDIVAECMAKPPSDSDPTVGVMQPWIIAAVRQAYPQMKSALAFDCSNTPRYLPLRALVALSDKLDPSAPQTSGSTVPKWTVVVTDTVKLSDVDLDRVMTSCVAASLIEENAVRPTADQPRNHGASLKTFFDIRVDRRVDGCSISIGPKISTLRVNDDEVPADKGKSSNRNEILDLLNFLLEGPGYGNIPDSPYSPEWPSTSAYGYSLSPRLRQNVEIRRDSRDNASVETAQGGGSFGRNRGLDYRGVEPEVVGFMRSAQSDMPHRGARFGWLLTPRPGKENTYSVPLEQAELSAVVALPSWWRSALLQICTRFVSQANMGGVFTDEFWSHENQCRVEAIRLPGSSLEVSRRLGMDVLTTPYMEAWEKPPVLLAGFAAEKTQLAIAGERLWRNTVVTLGGQKADRIEVLPDMGGIVATFECVRRPTTMAIPIIPLPESTTTGPVQQEAAAPPAAPAQSGKTMASTVAVAGAVAKDAATTLPTASAVGRQDASAYVQPVSYSVPVTVWTSEGHTVSQNVTVNVDKTFRLCPREPGDQTPLPQSSVK